MTGQPAVYILASARHGTLYTGVTSDLIARIWQHREHAVEGFTKNHGMVLLVWYELHDTMDSAITREKRIKTWNRSWKLDLVQSSNPTWRDLWPEISGDREVGVTTCMGPRVRGDDGCDNSIGGTSSIGSGVRGSDGEDTRDDGDHFPAQHQSNESHHESMHSTTERSL